MQRERYRERVGFAFGRLVGPGGIAVELVGDDYNSLFSIGWKNDHNSHFFISRDNVYILHFYLFYLLLYLIKIIYK